MIVLDLIHAFYLLGGIYFLIASVVEHKKIRKLKKTQALIDQMGEQWEEEIKYRKDIREAWTEELHTWRTNREVIEKHINGGN